MTSKYDRAKRLEKEGELAAAAVLYTEDGFQRLNRTNFEPNTTYRIGLATLIKAISIDARVGNRRRAVAVRDSVIALLDLALVSDPSSDDVLEGLYREWIGDCYLLTRSEQADQQYMDALAIYSERSREEFLSWSMEQEFDYVLWAVQSFLDYKGVSDEQLPSLDFENRIEQKRQYVTEMCD
ncbi:hypothetical protein AB7C87_07545 [Natrarchaeobius sp. A-rgal3]|uniref:hypothetical protein n=1 Tax=Natrarchaeobius versutus TaxID=1679078 RepID=UPI00350F61C1